MTVLADTVDHTGSDVQLVIAALLGIAAVVLLITWLKVHPFLALILGSAVLGAVAAVSPGDIITSFTTGLGSTTGSVGLLIALGAMIGGLLTQSGGADRIVTSIVDRVGPRALPWAMGGVAALIGIPLFFEIGVVLLIPIVLLVARGSDQPVLRVGIPALAGLSVLHGFVPPHPGPLVAIANLNADLGLVLLFGLIVAVPTVIVAGPLFGPFIAARVRVVHPPPLVAAGAGRRETGTTGSAGLGPTGDADDVDLGQARGDATDVGGDERPRRQPALGATVATILAGAGLQRRRAAARTAGSARTGWSPASAGTPRMPSSSTAPGWRSRPTSALGSCAPGASCSPRSTSARSASTCSRPGRRRATCSPTRASTAGRSPPPAPLAAPPCSFHPPPPSAPGCPARCRR